MKLKTLYGCLIFLLLLVGSQPLCADDNIPIGYQEAVPWGNQLLKVRRGKSYGLLRKSGEVVLNADYSRISDLNCYGKAILQKGSKYGIVNSDGDVLVPVKYQDIYDFKDASLLPENIRLDAYGNAQVSLAFISTLDTLLTDAEYLAVQTKAIDMIAPDAIIDGHGNVILKNENFHIAVSRPVNGMMRWWGSFSLYKQYGYYNLESKKDFIVKSFEIGGSEDITSIRAWSHGDFIGDIAPVRDGDTFFFINKNGEKVKDGYDVQCNATEDIWIFYKDGQSEIVNSRGETLFTKEGYTDLHFPPSSGNPFLLAAKSNNKWGVVTMDGQQLIPFKYDDAEILPNDLFRVAISGQWGIVDKQGKSIVPCKYMDIEMSREITENACWVEPDDSLYHIFLIKERKQLPTGYNYICAFKDGYAWAQPNDSLYLKRSQVDEGERYGAVVGADGQTYFSSPIKYDDYPLVVDFIHQNGDKPLGSLEGRRLLLYMTRNERSYRFENVIPEEEWDY